MATQSQIEHINQHLDLFHGHAGDNRTPEEYLNEYSYIPDIYERLCDDLGLEPIQEGTPMTSPAAPDIQALIQAEFAKAVGSLNQQAQGPQPVSFEEVLAEVDPRDSDAALAMLDFLLKTGRLHRVGVLDGGQGYLFVYQEPKGASKQGYTPGSTQGDRIVDAAVDQQRAEGKKPSKRGLCPHCYSAVCRVDDGPITLDDDTNVKDAEVCSSSPDGLHGLA